MTMFRVTFRTRHGKLLINPVFVEAVDSDQAEALAREVSPVNDKAIAHITAMPTVPA